MSKYWALQIVQPHSNPHTFTVHDINVDLLLYKDKQKNLNAYFIHF